MAGYLLLTFVLVFILEPGLTPPGFTGRGLFAMPVVLFGAFHTAKWCRSGAVFLVYGCFAALPLLARFMGDSRLGLRLSSPADVRNTLVVCVVGVVAMGLSARLAASVRWRLKRRIIDGPPLCGTCGYDLRASNDRCPECGTVINTVVSTEGRSAAKATSVAIALYVATVMLLRPHRQPASATILAPTPTTPFLLILGDEPQGALPTFVCDSANQTPPQSSGRPIQPLDVMPRTPVTGVLFPESLP